MDRITKLCSYLDKCVSFADIGCDHGYCTLYMLENKLCERAYIADVSEKCLAKAEALLSGYIKEGTAVSVCCDGLEKIPADCGQVLIAGMGGEEILKILKNSFIPKKFVFQPMKNSRALREYLLKNGAEIAYDGIFKSGKKFYTVIKGAKSGKTAFYTEAELEYGKGQGDAKEFFRTELEKKYSYFERTKDGQSRERILHNINLLKEVLK